MESIKLVHNGIFPLKWDKNGKLLSHSPDTNLDIPGTIQGEGKYAGVPALFIRTSGCNLRCAWTLQDGETSICDTPYSSFNTKNEENILIDDIIHLLRVNRSEIDHVIISGGEPFIQRNALGLLAKKIKTDLQMHVTVETNGTIFDEETANWIDFYSISPKLSNSNPTREKLASTPYRSFENIEEGHNRRRSNPEAVQAFINATKISAEKDFQLKFVYGNPKDELEIKEYLSQLKDWKKEDILIMPLGKSKDELKQIERNALEICIKNGWRYSPRIHIDLFGDKPGV